MGGLGDVPSVAAEGLLGAGCGTGCLTQMLPGGQEAPGPRGTAGGSPRQGPEGVGWVRAKAWTRPLLAAWRPQLERTRSGDGG